MKYDIFLSYKSEDHEWVEELKVSLQKRGVSVWLDKDAIRPGDLFAQALENGISSSNAIAIIVTPKSMKSKWVKEEYYRALSLTNQDKINLIPCILQHSDVPSFLSNRHYLDFTDSDKYEINVDRLVFPGITGKQIRIESFSHDGHPSSWEGLVKVFREDLGYSYISGLSSSRMSEWLHYKKRKDSTHKTYRFGCSKHSSSVIIIDLEDRQWMTDESIKFILECRNSKERTYKNIIFIFYHSPNFLDTLAKSKLPDQLRERFTHYYVIEKTLDINKLRQSVRNNWNFVMQDLMSVEHAKK